jgi:hypothetical protein
LHRICRIGAELDQIAQLLLGELDLPEQRIAEHFVQLGEESILVSGRKVAQVDVIGLRHLEQDLRRDRALVALDQVDVARRHAELVGHLGLRQPELAPDPPKARPHEQFGGRLGARF